MLVVGPDNVVQRKIVKTGQRQGQLRIIESGLDPGDWVVTEGVQRAFPAPRSIRNDPSDVGRGRSVGRCQRTTKEQASPTRRPNEHIAGGPA